MTTFIYFHAYISYIAQCIKMTPYKQRILQQQMPFAHTSVYSILFCSMNCILLDPYCYKVAAICEFARCSCTQPSYKRKLYVISNSVGLAAMPYNAVIHIAYNVLLNYCQRILFPFVFSQSFTRKYCVHIRLYYSSVVWQRSNEK